MNKNNTISIILGLVVFVTINCKATTYYVSAISGNDTNSGITESQPWKSLDKVNSFAFFPGDSILFKRNETWRGQLIPKSGNSSADIYYGAYSTGVYPVIMGSLSFNDISDWTNTGGNLWKCNTTFLTDIGNIIFDNSSSVGFKKWNQIDMQTQDDFWYNLATGELLIYSASNPANIHAEIELALRQNIVEQQNTSYVTYANLSIMYGGAHGFGGGNTSHITIKSCEISYMGGGDLNMDGNIRYGNGVEFWGNASNNTVEKCKIWEIYDTGVTNQNHTSVVVQKNIKYQNNIIWNCGLSSFEFWCKPAASITSDIYFENNTCLYAGSGWGMQRPDYHGIHILISDNTAQTDTIFIRNNILHEAQRSIYAISEIANGNFKIDYNLLYQPSQSDSLFVFFPSYTVYTYSEFVNYTNNTGHDINSLADNPSFVNPAALDFSLTNNSIAINTGTSLNIFDDFDGNPRPIYGMYDIGAYEYSGPLNILDNERLQNILIYPNPAKKSFCVSFNPDGQNYNLYLYNLEGKLIKKDEDYFSEKVINTEFTVNGTYIVMLRGDAKIVGMKKILIQR